MSRSSRTIVAVALAALSAVATLAVAGVGPASASTLNGIATTATPSNDKYLASGGSNTEFTVTLPANAACTGDTAHGGYRVWSYLVQKSADIATTTFSSLTGPSQGFGLYESDLNYYGPVNTAQNTGQIIGIPNDFSWGAGIAGGAFTAPDLLYTGGTSGIWEGGIACATSSGVLSDNWNTEVTFTKATSDPNGFTWSAVPGPSGSTAAAITSTDSASFTEGTAGSFTPTATGSPPPTITETGPLPTGVTFTGGALTGTPTESGTFPITFTATNGIGNPATQAFTLTVGGPPSFTSADNAAFTEGDASSFTPVATGSPAPTITESGALPTGVTFTGGSLTGTPTVTGTFPITFTASNGILPNATQDFTLTVGIPPVITSASSTTFSEGSPSTFTPTATGTPAPVFSETGALPTGVTFTGGSLTGTPTVTGTFPITFTASNGIAPDATQAFTLTVGNGPAFTSPDSTSFIEGQADSFTPTASGTPAPTITESGPLPTGVTFTAGALTGTPTVTGTFPITFTASNGAGPDAHQDFTLNVGVPPVITSAAATTFVAGTPGTFTPTATGTPAPIFSETGALPTGVTFTGGSLTGTPTEGGVFPITFTAGNGILPDATQAFVLTVNAPAAITSAASTTFFTGTANTFTVTATGTPAPALAESGPLPVGVTFDAATGVLSGTPTAPAQAAITFTATNGIGSPATQSFTLTVSYPPLVLTTTSLPTGTVGVPYSQTLAATGGHTPFTWALSAGALPAGLTLNASTGVISGSPTAAGTADFTAKVTDGNGTTATAALSIGIATPVVAPTTLTLPVVGMASMPNGNGYWLVDAAGDVAPFGSALTHGSLAGVRLNAPITRIVATTDGGGYWLVGADGGIFSFGDAGFYGSTGGMRLNAPIVGLTPTSDGHGYWLVGADGGVFSFGDAVFRGSMGGVHLNKPVVGIAADNASGGYWLVAADGGIFAFRAPFYGTTAGGPLNSPINGLAVTADGGGYWLVAGDGGIFSYGDAVFRGSMGGVHLNKPVVGIAADAATGGYWLVAADGGIFSFHAPFYGAG